MDRLHENRIYTGTVESYSSEGLGIVRLDGAVVFVPQAVRGETIDLKITKVMKTAAAGEIVKIHKPSPDRAQPECPDYGRCGGCDFQHLTYPEELWAKRQRVQDALTRLGGADIRVEEILGAKNPLHYRNKSQYPVGADGAIGFYRARSHQVVPVKRCLIQPEAADKTAAAVGEWMRRYKVPAYDEATGKGLVRHVYVRVNRKGESLCCVVINGRQAPREPELAAGITARISEEGGVLEYDGLALETGPLDGDGLSPVSALPALLSAARSEYMAECTLERTGDSELLRVLCADPEDPPGTGRETALWFDPETYALVRGEISVDGYRVIQCELTGFTRG